MSGDPCRKDYMFLCKSVVVNCHRSVISIADSEKIAFIQSDIYNL